MDGIVPVISSMKDKLIIMILIMKNGINMMKIDGMLKAILNGIGMKLIITGFIMILSNNMLGVMMMLEICGIVLDNTLNLKVGSGLKKLKNGSNMIMMFGNLKILL